MFRFVWPAFVCAFVVAAQLHAEEPKKEEPKKEEPKKINVKTDKDKASYYAGMNIGQEVKGIAATLDTQALTDSLFECLDGKASKQTEAESEKLMASFSAFMQATQAAAAGPDKATPAPTLADKDKVSYAIGQDIGKNIKPVCEFVDLTLFKSAFVSAIKGEAVDFKFDDNKDALDRYTKIVQAAQAEKAAKEEKDFFDTNGKKEGVVTTASGLQYKILKAGTGEKASGKDKVSVHYEGRLTNGKVFDSSIKRNEPFETGVDGGVIEGWLEVLKLMPAGSKWEVYIPSKLGYGPRGAGQDIPPNSILIFNIELLSVKKAEAAK